MMKIVRIATPKGSELKDVNRLLRQLSASARSLDARAYRRLLGNKSYALFAAKDGARIVGMASLVLMEIPVAFRSRLEDVVVDEAYRGQGLATRLSEAIIAYAKKKGAVSIDLTSSPDREAANRLYQKLGFVKRDTNVYRLKFK